MTRLDLRIQLGNRLFMLRDLTAKGLIVVLDLQLRRFDGRCRGRCLTFLFCCTLEIIARRIVPLNRGKPFWQRG